MTGYSVSSDVICYWRSANRILIQFSDLTLLEQSARCNIKPILQSTVSVMKKKLFRNVEVKNRAATSPSVASVTFFRIAYLDILEAAMSGPR